MLIRHARQFLMSSSFMVPHCGHSVIAAPFLPCLDQTVAHSHRDCMGAVSDLQLPIDILHLTFDLDLAPEQLLSDLFIRTSIRYKPHYLDFRHAEPTK